MLEGHETLKKFLLPELHTLDFLTNIALYTWHSRVCVAATYAIFKIMI